MTDLLLIFIGACLVNNLVLDHLLGVDPAMAMSRTTETALCLGLAMAVFAPAAAMIGYWFDLLVLIPLELKYMRLPALVLILTAVLSFGLVLIRRLAPALYRRIYDITPLLMSNCALLGVVLLNALQTHSFMATLTFGLGSAAGMALVVTALAAMHERLAADIPVPFQGAAIRLISLGLFSMAFMGFTGPGPS